MSNDEVQGPPTREELVAMLKALMSSDCGRCGMDGVYIGWQDKKEGQRIIDEARAMVRREEELGIKFVDIQAYNSCAGCVSEETGEGCHECSRQVGDRYRPKK